MLFVLIVLPIFILVFWPLCSLVNFGLLRLFRIKIPRHSTQSFHIIIFGPLLNLLALFFVFSIFEQSKPSQADIIGFYEIDRSFYPGPNADWQHATYEFEIGEDFASIRDARTNTTQSYPIEWIYGYRWRFADDGKRHHLISDGPTIYRHTFSHSYIFHSPLYGNVKFKKKSHGFWKWFAAGIAVLLICKALWPKHDLSRWLNISRFRIRPPSL